MRFEKVDKQDLSSGVARQLRTAILTGARLPGELLPPERELAAQFGVDRHTLRSALTELEQLGLVERRQGSGCRVLDFRETATLDLIKYLVVKPGTDELDLAMVGPVLEVGQVALAGLLDLVVERADADDVTTMRAALDDLGLHYDAGDVRALVASERVFFRRVFEGTHSIVALLLVNTLEQIFDAAIDPEERVRARWDDAMVSSGRLDLYGHAIDAIARRDKVKARSLLDDIFETIPAAVATADAPPNANRRRRRRQQSAG